MARKYKLNDLIVSSWDSRVNSDTIGSLCFAGDSLEDVLSYANNVGYPPFFLVKVNYNDITPFTVTPSNKEEIYDKYGRVTLNFKYIAFAKDTEIPFKEEHEFIEGYNKFLKDWNTYTNRCLSKNGIWLRRKSTDSRKETNFELVIRVSEDGVYLNKRFGKRFYNWDKLLKKYCFLNKKPCGKEIRYKGDTLL